jgi:hypothetical protein
MGSVTQPDDRPGLFYLALLIVAIVVVYIVAKPLITGRWR